MESLPSTAETIPKLAAQVEDFLVHAELADRISQLKETTVEDVDDYTVTNTRISIGEAEFECEITARIDLRERQDAQVQELRFGIFPVVDSPETPTDQIAHYAHLDFYIGPDSSYIELDHREVHTQSLGLNGSAFLHLVERQVKDLIEADHLPERPIVIKAGQPRVIDWALRNGYAFMTDQESELYERIKTNQAEHVLDDIHLAGNPDPYLVQYDAEAWQSAGRAKAAILAVKPQGYQNIKLSGVTPLRFGLTKTLS